MTYFETLAPALSQALSARGYATLTPVQEAVLAPELQSADLIVSAQTGSGKTVAFGLALAESLLGGENRFAPARAPLALVIAPTRELALQVKRELDWLYAPTGAQIVSCVGGMDPRDERRALDRGAHIIVGTPGRLVDHIKRGSLITDAFRAIVLDEADEMLDLGFREELEHILDASPADRRTLMFSATMPRAIETLAKRYQRDAQRVNTVSEQRQHVDIDYRALTTTPQDVENAVFNVLRYYDAPNSIVFCGTRAAVNRMTSRFTNRGLSVVALSGELTQSERSHALQAMRDKRAQVCVATDVAARGIDLPELELVIHADLPRNGEALLHRSGRTGRAGRKGTSVLIVPHKARKRTERLLKDAKITANWGDPPTADEIIARDNARLLKDPLLATAIEDAEREFAQDLLDSFTSEQIAAAFIRLHRKGKGAPEDIAATPEDGLERQPRDARSAKEPKTLRKPARANFENSVWVKLSVGRKKSAEPRWLLPVLCKAGGVTKAEIGAIRIGEADTHVELTPDGANQLFTKIGMDGLLENAIRATRVDGPPNAAGDQGIKDAPALRRPRPKPAASKSQDYAKRRKPRGEEDNPWEQSAEATPVRKPRGKPSAKTASRPKRKPAKAKPSKTPPQNRNKRKWSPR